MPRVRVRVRVRVKVRVKAGGDASGSPWLVRSSVDWTLPLTDCLLQVGETEIKEFVDLSMLVLENPGVNRVVYKNLVVYAYRFPLRDGMNPEKDPKLVKPVIKPVEAAFPYGDPELVGFVKWWEDLYGTEYLGGQKRYVERGRLRNSMLRGQLRNITLRGRLRNLMFERPALTCYVERGRL